jgi:hypothetical protein
MLVQVAETLGKRARLATEIIKGVILPQFVILPLAVLLVWLALARGISPLNELQRRIRAAQSSDLSPIDEARCPTRWRRWCARSTTCWRGWTTWPAKRISGRRGPG